MAYAATPPRGAAFLYSNRAVTLLKTRCFFKAGEDARAGLTIFSGSEALGLEQLSALEFIKQLTAIARDADLGVAVEQRRDAAKGDADASHQVKACGPAGPS